MKKVLLVEDNQMLQEILAERLEMRGYHVIVADNGADALSLAKRELPQIILMDMSLPIMDGWEATRLIRENPNTSKTPIIALTAHAFSKDRERSLEAGCNEFETKPVQFAHLLAKIEKLLAENINQK